MRLRAAATKHKPPAIAKPQAAAVLLGCGNEVPRKRDSSVLIEWPNATNSKTTPTTLSQCICHRLSSTCDNSTPQTTNPDGGPALANESLVMVRSCSRA